MSVPISNVTRRQVYAPSGAGGAGPYAFTFEILANTDIAVYKDDVLLTLTTHYTVTINANGTGSVTITATGLALEPTSPSQYAIVGNRTISRSTDFTTGGDFFANVLNDELDQQTIFAQQNAEGLQRALSAPQTDPTSINMVLPRAADRANKTLNFDSNGNPVAGLTVTANATAAVATFLATPTSANLRAAVTDETGGGELVFADAPTFAGNPIINSGTANGVAYLNGSKVLTTGSALTFDGSLLNTTGSIRAQNSLFVYGTGDRLNVFPQTAGSGVQLVSTNNANSAYAPLTLDGSATIFNASGGEQMRLTSTGLGIGTSSPSSALYVKRTSGNAGIYADYNGTNIGRLEAASNGNLYVGTTTGTGALLLGTTANAAALELNNSGNLGLGVTPSAWSTLKAIQLPAGSLASFDGGAGSRQIGVFNNAYFDGTNFLYVATDTAQGYRTIGGQHLWLNAPSGTAGNAITFTQAMTLGANGNLAVGDTSTGNARLFSYISDASLAAINARQDGAGPIQVWNSGGSELARITSGGDLLVGDTAQVDEERLLVKKNTTTKATQRVWNTATTGNNGFVEFATEGTYTARGGITYNGAGGLVAYNTTSDYRAKDIFGPVSNPGATIDALKVYEGRMKGATQSRPMLVAHEAQAVTPYAVTGEKDAVNEDGNLIFQQMDVSSLVPLLIAEIQSLRQRVAQLEGRG
jgi:hypothetical protein